THTYHTKIYTLSLHDALPISTLIGAALFLAGCSNKDTFNYDRGLRPYSTSTPIADGGVAGDPEEGEVIDDEGHRIVIGDRSYIKDRKSTRLNSSHDQISYAVF